MTRDNFLQSTTRQLAENSSYFCNNPDCRHTTVLNTSGNRSSKYGVAAHICAASENGPRYDSSQTREERSSYDNGIWLCANCSILIDRDVEKYSKELLKSWKDNHQKWLLENNNFRSYEDLTRKFNEISNRLIENNKSIHKYIPELYCEISSIKEISRFFSNPCLFWNKIIDTLERIDFKYLNKYSSEFGICEFNFDYPEGIKRNLEFSEIYSKSLQLDDFLSRKKNELSNLKDAVYAEGAIESIPPLLQYKYENVKHKHYFTITNYIFKIEIIDKLNKAIHSQILLITSSAGKGKTSFLCDFSANFLDKCNIPFIFINASELDRIDKIEKYFMELSCLNGEYKKFENFALNYQLDFENESESLVIIIDGLNEVININEFDTKLYDFIKQILNYKYIKLICTCRSEFFEHRFKNFSKLPSVTLLLETDFDQEISEKEKSKLWQKYLMHFNISINKFSKNVYEKLTENPLLLRIFSEVNTNLTINELTHLYTETVFRKYFDLKIVNIGNSKESRTSIEIQKDKVAKDIFKKILQLMIFKKEYTNIKINELNLEKYELEELSRIINEDILLKKDLGTEDVLTTSHEVINFTFDEMRDFLIANQLVHTLYLEEPSQFSDFLDNSLIKKSTIYEGVSKFIFHISTKMNDNALKDIIETQPWFEEIFVEEIFNVEDEYITYSDIEKVKYLFLDSKSYCTKLLLKLTSNCNPLDKLNISIIFDILKTMSNEQYESLLKSNFTVNRTGNNYQEKIDMSVFFDLLSEKLIDTLHNDDPIHNYFKLLILLMGVDEPLASKSYHLFKQYFKKYPNKCDLLFSDFESVKVPTIKYKLQEIQE